MKRILVGLFAIASLILPVGPSFAVSVSSYPSGTVAGGIVGSRHNMGSFGKVLATSNGTTEVCVFCHTPHHTNTANNLVPMWNRGTSAPTSFTAYGTTIGGTTIANTDIGSTSLACLSCHDGVTTFDNLVNAPGKGGVSPTGSDRGWKFKMPVGGGNVAWDHFMSGTTGNCYACHTLGWGSVNPADRLTIGLDVSNDHPISVPYNGAASDTDFTGSRASLRPTNTMIASIDLTTGLEAGAPTAFGGNLAQNRWAVKGVVTDTGTIADLLRGGKVECTSCHDPHFRNLSWDEVEPTWDDEGGLITYCTPGEGCTDGNFLRRVGGNTGSGVCRTCHAK